MKIVKKLRNTNKERLYKVLKVPTSRNFQAFLIKHTECNAVGAFGAIWDETLKCDATDRREGENSGLDNMYTKI